MAFESAEKQVAFVCTPNLGILDNWMPVLWDLKNKNNDFQFSIILPKARYIEEADTENVLFKLSEDIFGDFIFKNPYGRWLKANSFSSAKKLIKVRWFERILRRFSNRFKSYRITRPLGVFLAKMLIWIDFFKTKSSHFDFHAYVKSIDCILYDITAEGKSYNQKWINELRDIPKFSISHGINPNDDTKYNLQDGYSALKKDKITAFVFTENEKQKCKTAFALEDGNIDWVGIPRHEADWMEFILEKHNQREFTLKNYVFLISRPHTTKYLPRERMKESLEEIKKIVWDQLDMNIIVKLHPKEQKTGVYEEVLGENNRGVKWDYSNQHPFVLGRNCKFAICYFSGVSIDMIRLDVPTIGKLDLHGIPKYETEDSLRDPETGDPVLIYRYLGFNLGASNYQQMNEHVKDILENREKVMDKLRKNYYSHFKEMDNPTNYITSKISKSLS